MITRARANSLDRGETDQGDRMSPPVYEQPAFPPVQVTAHTQQFTPSSMVPPAMASAPTTITMTDAHLHQLIAALRVPIPLSAVSAMGSHRNFAKCTSRFDGAPTTDVVAFIEAIEIYKECVAMEDSIALRGLPMLLTGLAGTWWQGVKHSICSWTDAILLLRQTFGPRLPPHKVYRELFSVEQTNEKTDVFVCRARALIAQLPPNTLPENPVQLDMIYGLLHRRIRERVPRASFVTFSELLEKARAIEDLLDEGRTYNQVSSAAPSNYTAKPVTTPTLVTVPSLAPAGTSTPASVSGNGINSSKIRSRCVYCKMYGHDKESCRKLSHAKKPSPASPIESDIEKKSAPIVCYGCGAPGVIRSQCSQCTRKDDVTSVSTLFQSIAALGAAPIDARARPMVNVKVCGVSGRVIIDTGAKLSIASVSLKDVLVKHKIPFVKSYIDIKLADGSVSKRHVETVNTNVKLHGVVIPTAFVVLPGATDTLLGMNFLRDAGMVLDLKRNRFSLESINNGRTYFSLGCEKQVASLVCSSVALREDEGTMLSFTEREILFPVLNGNEDIFKPGGAPTTMARHRIDTGENLPTAVPPYRLTPGKKTIVRAEIDKMLKQETIEEADETCDVWPVSIDFPHRDLPALRDAQIEDPQITPNLRKFVSSLQEVRWRQEHQQDLRKVDADRSRRKGPTFQEGDLILIENHAHSQAAKGITKKFTPRRIGPFIVNRIVSPTTFEVVDHDGRVKGKYHSSALTPYSGESEPVVAKQRGRPKSQPGRSCDLEGENVAKRNLPPRTSRQRKRRRYRDD